MRSRTCLCRSLLSAAVLIVTAESLLTPLIRAQQSPRPNGTSAEQQSATANDAIVEKWRPRIRREAEKLRTEDPKRYQEDRIWFISRWQALLGKYGYGAALTGEMDEQTRNALRTLQTRLKLTGTGELYDPVFLAAFEKLVRDDSRFEEVAHAFDLPSKSVMTSQWENGYVSVKGTWVLDNGHKMGYPIQTSVIECRKDIGVCVEAMADIFDVEALPGRSLRVSMEFDDIDRWDQHEIVTAPKDSLCNRYVRRISRATQEVTATRSTIETELLCANSEKRELHMRLVDGRDVMKPIREEVDRMHDRLRLHQGRARQFFETADDSADTPRRTNEAQIPERLPR